MPRRVRNNVVGRVLLVGVLCGAASWAPTAALADPTSVNPDLNADQRELVEQLTVDKIVAVARERRLADLDQEKLYDQLKERGRALRAAVVRASGNAAELARIRKQRDQLATERQSLVTALAQRDQSLAAEVRAYREVVTGIVTSPDPREQRALQRFADGEQREALHDLDVIAKANRAARLKAVDIADAATLRKIAVLAVQSHDEGNAALGEVIERYEQITRLDPGTTWDWIYLARLYDEQGRLDDARKAAQSAYASVTAGGDERLRSTVLSELAGIADKSGDVRGAKALFEESLAIDRKLANNHSPDSQRDLGISLSKLGDIAVEAGDLPGAKARFEESLRIGRKFASDHPTDIEAQRDLCINLNRLGNVAVQTGDLAEAKSRFSECLLIDHNLLKRNPISARAQRDLGATLGRLGRVAVQAGDLSAARAFFEEMLAIFRKLVKDLPDSAQAQRDLSVAFDELGNLALQQHDLPGAKALFEESLGIRRKLAKDNPTSAEAQGDLSSSFDKLGDVAFQLHDFPGAKARFSDGLAIRRKLAHDNAASAKAERDLVFALVKLGLATRDRTLLTEALKIARALDRAGRLPPSASGLVGVITEAIQSLP